MKKFIQSVFFLKLVSNGRYALEKKLFCVDGGFEVIFWVVGCYEYVLEGVSFFLG